MDFINFSDIDLQNSNSWKGKAILSFDIDWAIDPVIDDVLDLLDEARIKATFFVTHQTETLNRIRANSKYELGIHPNFNPLIEKGPNALSARETLVQILKIVPEAKVLRSHGMTHSGRWLSLYRELGIEFLSQYYMGGVNSIQPFAHINGLVEAPIFFADDGFAYENEHGRTWDMESGIKANKDFLKVFNFHPIHIKLNTPNFTYYDKARHAFSSINELNRYIYSGFGVRDIFKKLTNQHG